MKERKILILTLLLLSSVRLSSQYLENPSFEGPPGLGISPPGWNRFDFQSTPDTEPLNCDDFQASHGDTYITLVAHGTESSLAGIPENCQAPLNEPLLEGFCYTLSMDLASRDDLGHYSWEEGFIFYRAPVKLRIYGSNSSTTKGTLLAETEIVTNENWSNSSFNIKPEEDIYYLLLEVAAVGSDTRNGNILVDNMVLSDINVESSLVFDESFSSGDLPIILEASEGTSYSWTPETDLSCYNCRSPQVNSDVSRTYSCLITHIGTECPTRELFTLTFEDIIVPEDDIKVPNVFTPNGDGINDFFEIPGLPHSSTLLIYDRSGREIYSNKSYEHEWDGSGINGNPLPQDNYWYVLIISGRKEKQKGQVYLKRD